MTGTIGIKEANGNFYPIVEANSGEKKRLVLVTAHDHQKSTQIDLYKSVAKSMVDAFYIGSIVLENTSAKTKDKTSIEMVVTSSPDGSISVDAVEVGNPSNEHHLSISLNSLEEDKTDYGDFDEEEDENGRHKKMRGRKRRFPWFAIIIIAVVAAMIGLTLWYFLVWNPVNITWPEFRQTAKAPETNVVASTANRIPQTIPPQGISYTVRWGVTLWDISEAFYRNPRLYPVIVRSNDIPNPKNIVFGTELIIPPRN